MKKQFFAVTLEGQQKYEFTSNNRTVFHQITMVSAKDEDTQIQLYGENGDHKIQLVTLNKKNTSAQVKITLSEDNFQTLYAVGDGTVDLSGYSLIKISDD